MTPNAESFTVRLRIAAASIERSSVMCVPSSARQIGVTAPTCMMRALPGTFAPVTRSTQRALLGFLRESHFHHLLSG
jgi:hypothetical protein